LLYSATSSYAQAAEQFRLALEAARNIQLDTEIGHLRRLYGSVLRNVGQLAEAKYQFEQAYAHERLTDYNAYWSALSARELGDTLMRMAGTASSPDASARWRLEIKEPSALDPAITAYHDGRLFFDGHLGEQSPFPLTRAAKQQMFRSFFENAIGACALARQPSDLLAELECSGPREATEAVAEILAQEEGSPEGLAEYRRARAASHQTLNTFPQAFDDYIARLQAQYSARRDYLQARIPLSSRIAKAQISDFVAEALLKLRIPQCVLLIINVGASSSHVVFADLETSQVESAPVPFNAQQIHSIHDEYVTSLRRGPDDSKVIERAVGIMLSRYEDIFGPGIERMLPFQIGRAHV